MSARISDYQANLWLADFGSIWLSLHTDNPNISGAQASELVGGAYVRTACTFTPPTNRTTWNANSVNFYGLPAATLLYVGIWDTQYNGNFMAGFPIPVAPSSGTNGRTVRNGESYNIASQSMSITVP